MIDCGSISQDVLNSNCDICEKSFKNKRGLKAHMRVHDSVPQIDGNVTLISDDGELDAPSIDEEVDDTTNQNEETNEDDNEPDEVDHVSNVVVERILVSNVASSCLTRLKPEDVEGDLVDKLRIISSTLLSFKYRRNQYGDFESGLAVISPVNLQVNWGRKLNVNHCSIIHYNPSF